MAHFIDFASPGFDQFLQLFGLGFNNLKEYCHECLRARAKITSQFWRSVLGQIWSIRLSKATGIAGYFEDFANEDRPKMA